MRQALGLLLACCFGAVPVGRLVHRPVSERWPQCRRAMAVFAFEMVLGAFAVWAARRTGGTGLRGEVILLAVTVGGFLSVHLGFHAGEWTGVFYGAILAVSGLAGAGTLLVAVCLLIFTRSAGIAAALGAACYPVGLWLLEHPGPLGLICAGAAACLVLWHHRTALRSA